LHLDEARFNDGTVLRLGPDSVILLVGPNNAGKSQALRDIEQALRSGVRGTVITETSFHKDGQVEDLDEWIQQNGVVEALSDGTRIYRRSGQKVEETSAEVIWRELGGPGLKQMTGMFVRQLGTLERLTLADSVKSFDASEGFPDNPLQELYISPDDEHALSAIAEEAFGQKLIVNRNAGMKIHLLCSDGRDEEFESGGLSNAQFEWLAGLPHVSQQGDGFRAFVGILLALISGGWPMTLVDEPEAFLHPPQARTLGRRLGRGTTSQLFVATHSHDVLQGAIEGGSSNLSIVRLSRTASGNQASVLEPTEVEALWKDSLLRHSGALDGLFYAGVVITESDADSRYYASVLDSILSSEGKPAFEWLFIQCAGKDRVARIAATMRKLGVPVRVIVDFDLLREERSVRDMVEALGEEWDLLRSDWSVVFNSIEASSRRPAVEVVRAEVGRLLDGVEGEELPKETATKISAVCKGAGGWRAAKLAGTGAVPSGDPSAACARLLPALEALGIFVVPVGELERWEPDVPGHGPSWLGEALLQERHKAVESACGRFVRRLAQSAGMLV
jgi:hypothetical protein